MYFKAVVLVIPLMSTFSVAVSILQQLHYNLYVLSRYFSMSG